MCAAMEELSLHSKRNMVITTILAGGAAGSCVDFVLYPLDTIRTRLQSKHGFHTSGGYRHLYKGITPVILSSVPLASLFFTTYEGIKHVGYQRVSENYRPIVHGASATAAEIIAGILRIPVEVIKQRKQALMGKEQLELRILYRGFWSTILRDVPFSAIQFTIWEFLKDCWSTYVQTPVTGLESCICGGLAGSVAAVATCPMDVIKTRIMLSNKNLSSSEVTIYLTMRKIYQDNKLRGFFAGVKTRTLWITLGGCIFFGTFEQMKIISKSILPH